MWNDHIYGIAFKSEQHSMRQPNSKKVPMPKLTPIWFPFYINMLITQPNAV